MKNTHKLILLLTLIVLFLVIIVYSKRNNTPAKVIAPEIVAPESTTSTNLANPASENCFDMGGTLSIITDEQGNQSGSCTLPSGTVCDEWALYRGECN